jgi:hypothetical protein
MAVMPYNAIKIFILGSYAEANADYSLIQFLG